MTSPRPVRPIDTGLTALLWAIGIMTAVPALALVAPGILETSYSVTTSDPTIVTLLRHRGALQGLLGAAIIWSALVPPVRPVICLGAAASKLTGLALVLPDPVTRSAVSGAILAFDAVSIVLLLLTAARQAASARR